MNEDQYTPEVWKFINDYDELGEYGVSAMNFQKLLDIADRAVSKLVVVTYGEPTIDFEWEAMKKQAEDLRLELDQLLYPTP